MKTLNRVGHEHTDCDKSSIPTGCVFCVVDLPSVAKEVLNGRREEGRRIPAAVLHCNIHHAKNPLGPFQGSHRHKADKVERRTRSVHQ